MKILLNVYACEPNRGSEPGVGWHWAIELSKDKNKEVHVLTRANNKGVIDKFWSHQINLLIFIFTIMICLPYGFGPNTMVCQ